MSPHSKYLINEGTCISLTALLCKCVYIILTHAKSILPIIATSAIAAMSAMADTIEYFESPSDRNVFKKGSFVHCSVNDMPDPHGHQVFANLYKEYSNGMQVFSLSLFFLHVES